MQTRLDPPAGRMEEMNMTSAEQIAYDAGKRRWTPLDYPIYYPSPVCGDLGDGEKILTAPIGRDTINTMEAPRRGEGRANHEKADC